jgi:hypothetical protein
MQTDLILSMPTSVIRQKFVIQVNRTNRMPRASAAFFLTRDERDQLVLRPDFVILL